MWCGVVWCGVVWCGVVWCGVVWCGVVWCGVVSCLVLSCLVLSCLVLCCVVLRYVALCCVVSNCTCCIGGFPILGKITLNVNARFKDTLSLNLLRFPVSEMKFCCPFSGVQSVLYSLYAVSNHSGSTYGGHYTAYCKHPISKEWHCFNDSR